MSDMQITMTSAPGCFQTGDIITMPITLSRWSRFLLWLASPFQWPPKTRSVRYVVTGVSNESSFEIERS